MTHQYLPPFAPGSISLRVYLHDGLPADEIVAHQRAQARRAAEVGFDGIMMGEHHGGFPGYIANTIQTADFMLDAMPGGWVAPAPVLLPLRPWALVAEDIAWLDARFPGRRRRGAAVRIHHPAAAPARTGPDLLRPWRPGTDRPHPPGLGRQGDVRTAGGAGGTDQLKGMLDKIAAYRAEAGLTDRPFRIFATAMGKIDLDVVKRHEDLGVTDMPVAFRNLYAVEEDSQPLSEKIDDMKRFADEVIAKF